MFYHTSINRMINDLCHAIFGNGVVTKNETAVAGQGRAVAGQEGKMKKKEKADVESAFRF